MLLHLRGPLDQVKIIMGYSSPALQGLDPFLQFFFLIEQKIIPRQILKNSPKFART